MREGGGGTEPKRGGDTEKRVDVSWRRENLEFFFGYLFIYLFQVFLKTLKLISNPI